jgi:hypothetical protein
MVQICPSCALTPEAKLCTPSLDPMVDGYLSEIRRLMNSSSVRFSCSFLDIETNGPDLLSPVDLAAAMLSLLSLHTFFQCLEEFQVSQRPQPLLRLCELHDCEFSTALVKSLSLLRFYSFRILEGFFDFCVSVESSRTRSAISPKLLKRSNPNEILSFSLLPQMENVGMPS